MRVVALVPFWEEYENNEFRIKKIAGRYLLSYSLEKLNNIDGIDEIYVYSSSKNFTKYVESNIKYTYLERSILLDSSGTTIEMIINNFLLEIDADIVVLLHPTSPLLKISSIQKCLNHVKSKEYDSSFSAVKHNKFSWYHNQPINYDLNKDIPKLNNIEPFYVEQASLYVFKKDIFNKNKHRISGNIYISEIDQIEGMEVRNKLDSELVELIINSGMYNEVL